MVAFLEWKGSWWASQAGKRAKGELELAEDLRSGLEGYANEQANGYVRLATSFAKKWADILRISELPSGWCDQYLSPSTSTGECKQLFYLLRMNG